MPPLPRKRAVPAPRPQLPTFIRFIHLSFRPGGTEVLVFGFPRVRAVVEQVRYGLRLKYLMHISNEARVRALRRDGVRIGENCLVYTTLFSTEPYLVDIGDNVAISSGTSFVTHDASGTVFGAPADMPYVYGRIEVGSHTYFGTNCTILAGSRIGSHCVIGSGSVVRGAIPDNSVVLGNPARVIMKTSLLKELLVNHRHRVDVRGLSPLEKEHALRRHFNLP